MYSCLNPFVSTSAFGFLCPTARAGSALVGSSGLESLSLTRPYTPYKLSLVLSPLASPLRGGLKWTRVTLRYRVLILRISSRSFSRHLFPRYALVGSSGLEPPTSRLSGARSNLLSYEPIWIEVTPAPWRRGGDDGIRTHDPLLAGQVLSQLSYTPSVSSPLSLPF